MRSGRGSDALDPANGDRFICRAKACERRLPACHGDSSLAKDVDEHPVHVDSEKFKHSMHGGMFACVDYHADVKTAPHANTPVKISCATCHIEEQAAYERSFHAKTKENDGPVATCLDCHGSPHELLPSSYPKSRTTMPTFRPSAVPVTARMGQEEGGISVAAAPKLSFQHPVDLGDIAQVNSSDCHTGGVGP